MAESSKDGRSKAPSAVDVLALLKCPVCERTFELPTTLRCGHTVCSVHVQLDPVDESVAAESVPLSRSTTESSERTAASSSSSSGPASKPDPLANLPSCPISTCATPSSRHRAPVYATVPSTSRVAYYPPPSGITGSPPPSLSALSTETRPKKVASPRLDITLSKILEITLSAIREEEQRERPNAATPDAEPHSSSDDDDDGDTEEERSSCRSSRLYATPSLGRSASVVETPPDVASRPTSSHRPASTTPSSRPSSTRKSPHSGSDSDRPRVKRRKTAPPSPPLGPGNPEAAAKFLKGLQAEVQCEICFSLLHQPVTTPCQHVSASPSLFGLCDATLMMLLSASPILYRLSARNVYPERWIIAYSARCADRIYRDSLTSTSMPLIRWWSLLVCTWVSSSRLYTS